MAHLKFDVSKIARLDDTGRFDSMKPDVMWDALGRPDARVIVDVGAGTGLFAQRFADVAPDATVYAVDTEPAMIEWMREHREGVAQGRIVPVLSQETGIPLDDGVADLVIMLNLHHELAEPDAIYREAARMLVSGGQILVVDWAPVDTPKGPPLEIRATAEFIGQSLEEAGFGQVSVHPGALEWHSLVTGVRP